MSTYVNVQFEYLFSLLLFFKGLPMKNTLKQLSLTIGLGCIALVSMPVFAVAPAPEMDGELLGQVGLLIAGVALVARAISKK